MRVYVHSYTRKDVDLPDDSRIRFHFSENKSDGNYIEVSHSRGYPGHLEIYSGYRGPIAIIPEVSNVIRVRQEKRGG